MIYIDYETRSKADLKVVGAYNYARHPSTEVICVAYAFGDAPVKISHPNYPGIPAVNWPPKDLIDAIRSGEILHAHNSGFEHYITKFVCGPKYGWPEAPQENWRCSLSVCAYRGLPRSLEDASTAMKLPQRKDTAGKKVMLKCSKPTGQGWHEDASDLKTTFKYCMQDVEVERAIDKKLGDLPPFELAVWLLDQKINERGIEIDVGFCRLAIDLAGKAKTKANIDIYELTGGMVSSTTERKSFADWSKTAGYDMSKVSLAAPEIPSLLGDPKIPDVIKQAIEIKTSVSLSSISKYKKAIELASPIDSRIRDNLAFYGGATGRWAGRGVQIQNFPRGYGKEMAEIVSDITAGHTDYAEFVSGDGLMSMLKKSTRGIIVPKAGHEIHVSDLSAIEARVILWLCEEEEGLEAIRTADIYCAMASRVFGYEVKKKDHPKERQLGKSIILGCFGENTMVLTSNGTKRIVDVELSDMLWDGVNWVEHEGVICKGEMETIDLAGVRVTPGHKVLAKGGWRSARYLQGGNLPSALSLAAKYTPIVDPIKPEQYRGSSLIPVYDILNSGSLSRFTVLTEKGPLIVSNCGFGMGYIKFNASLEKDGTYLSEDLVRKLLGDRYDEYRKAVISDSHKIKKQGISLKEKIHALIGAKFLVDTYRASFPKIKAAWRAFEDVARAAIKNPGCEYQVAKVSFYYDEVLDILECRLPAGRCISYPQPRLSPSYSVTFNARNKSGALVKIQAQKDSIDGNERDKMELELKDKGLTLEPGEPDVKLSEKISYMRAEKGGFRRASTYGASMLQSAVQGIARDVIAESLLKAESRGFVVIFSCHDETVTEDPIGTKTYKQLEHLMSETPTWADGMPIAAEGFTSRRYHK